MAGSESAPSGECGPAREWLSPEEFAAYSGLAIATVRRRVKDKLLPSVQLGGPHCRVLIRKTALEELSGDEPKTPPITPPSADSAYDPDEKLPGPLPRWKRRRRNKN